MNHNHDNALRRRLPCEQNPDTWFDPNQQGDAGRQCLRCTNRRQCAVIAVRTRAQYGMWAGVWIDGDLSTKQHLLAYTPLSATSDAVNDAPSDDDSFIPTGLRPLGHGDQHMVGRLQLHTTAPEVLARITARASGHCEIMAPACTYQQDAIFSRHRGVLGTSQITPAAALAVCRNCIDLIEHTDLAAALHLGYIVEPHRTMSSAAVFWRQRRWVYLDASGRLQPCPVDHLTVSA